MRTGPFQHAVVRREPHCDGKGRQGLRRLGEGSGERNEDSEEDEGAEAHRAVHRLVTGKGGSSVQVSTLWLGCCHCGVMVTGASPLVRLGLAWVSLKPREEPRGSTFGDMAEVL